MTFLRKYRAYTSPVDIIALIFSSFVLILAIVFHSSVNWQSVCINILFAYVSILLVIYLTANYNSGLMRSIHVFYIMPIVFLIFKTVEKVSFALHGKDYDDVLIALDRMLFGVDPTVWLYGHIKLQPIVVEILQICYFSYYLLFILLAVELYLRRRSHSEGGVHDDEVEDYRFTVVYGFFLSYIGYLSLPAIGPRFTLHDFSSLPVELPGLWLTESLRYLINIGENINTLMPVSEIVKHVTRDVFPSGHTQLTVITMILAFRYRARSRWIISLLGCGLVISTVLLRYHYVIDVIAGLVFAVLTIATSDRIRRYISRLLMR
jgi:membrane-associated phospholipid phosphatase